MGRDHLLNIRIQCRCRHLWPPGCVRIERQVPPDLQCPPRGGGSGGGDGRIRCGKCGHVCFEGIDHLRKIANEITRSRGWGRYRDDGFVPVPCDG